MMPIEPIRDVMRRTMFNLEFVEGARGVHGPFEVTQLINSLLGALVHPYESMDHDLMALPLADAARRGWPTVASKKVGEHPKSLGEFIRMLRNAVAHANIDFLPSGLGEIQAVRVWNVNRGICTWSAILSVAELRRLLVCFVDLAEDVYLRGDWHGKKIA